MQTFIPPPRPAASRFVSLPIALLLTCAVSVWALSAHAIPPIESADAQVAASTTAKGSKNAKPAAKGGSKVATAKATSATMAAAVGKSPFNADDKLPLSESQKLEKHDILQQPSADFVCPHTNGGSATECFMEAVEHLYTVCRNVKSIELIEFGFDKAENGSNGFKSEFCRRKQKASLPPYFQAALREAQAMSSCEAAQNLNDLYAVWYTTMSGLRQHPRETEGEYKERITVPYLAFAAYRQKVREALADAGAKPGGRCPTLAQFKP